VRKGQGRKSEGAVARRLFQFERSAGRVLAARGHSVGSPGGAIDRVSSGRRGRDSLWKHTGASGARLAARPARSRRPACAGH
jgi:hypothetical protein